MNHNDIKKNAYNDSNCKHRYETKQNVNAINPNVDRKIFVRQVQDGFATYLGRESVHPCWEHQGQATGEVGVTDQKTRGLGSREGGKPLVLNVSTSGGRKSCGK